MENNGWKIFKGAFNFGYKLTTKAGSFAIDQIKKNLDNHKYRESINSAKSLGEPDRTLIIVEIVSFWKKNPELQFSDDIINAVNIITEPSRTNELRSLVALFASKKMNNAVKKVSSLL